MKKKGARSFEPGRHRRGTEARLVAGGYLILIVIGGALVWLLYGRAAALTAVICLLAMASIVVLLWLILSLLERWVGEDEL
ncbi:MAG: hypothetical protein JXA93_13245 [Anaerolineae bacterium]|nr:hypothetical protein [Anaerolineae bacterium]